jgi:hypothetical protein
LSDHPTEQLFQEIEASGLYLGEALERFKLKIDRLDNDSSLYLVRKMIDKEKIFHYLPVIGYILRKTVSVNDNFFAILKTVVDRTSRDITQPTILNELVNAGADNPKIGLEVYDYVKKIGDESLVFACRWIFAGVGINEFNLIYEIVLSDITSNRAELRIASISAIRVTFSRGLPDQWRKQILSILNNLEHDRDQRVRRELLNTYITLYGFAKDPCFSGILRLCEIDSQLSLDASNLLMHGELNIDHYLELLKFLASSTDPSVIEMVLLSFYSWARKEIIEPELQIVYELLKRFSFFDMRQIDQALNELGKADLETCLNYLYCWQGDANYKLKFYLPRVAVAMAKSDLIKLVDTFNPILFTEKMGWFIFETSRILLEEIFERSSEGKNLSITDKLTVNRLLESLKNLAKSKGLNSDAIANREQLTIFKCLVLIEVMNKVQTIDFKIIRRNIDQFPQIRGFLGEKWLNKMERDQNTTHPLLVFLADPLLDEHKMRRGTREAVSSTSRKMQELEIVDSMRNRSLLLHLDDAISSIKDDQSLKKMKDALRQEEQFWKVFSEIDVRSRLAAHFNLAIEPPLEIVEDGQTKTKHPDFGLTFEGKEIYLEVISPEMFPPLRYFNSAGIPNRVRDKITDEIKHHFKGMLIPKDVIIIVDLASSELRYESIQNYVEGELQFVFRVNTKTRESEGVFTERGEPMSKVDPETQIIVGIIGYSRVIGKDKRIHLRGRTFPNENALNKSRILEEIAKKLFG